MKIKTAGILALSGIAAMFSASAEAANISNQPKGTRQTIHLQFSAADECLLEKSSHIFFDSRPKSKNTHEKMQLRGAELATIKTACEKNLGPLAVYKGAKVITPSPYRRPE